MIVEKRCLALSACVSSLLLLVAGVGCQKGDSSQTTAASNPSASSNGSGEKIGVFGFHGATVEEDANTMVTQFVSAATGATQREKFGGTSFLVNNYNAQQEEWVQKICNSGVSSVLLFGYSRGGVSALDAAHALRNGACGGNAPQVRWVGVVDPVGTGIPDLVSQVQPRIRAAIDPSTMGCALAPRNEFEGEWAWIWNMVENGTLSTERVPSCRRLKTVTAGHQGIPNDSALLADFIRMAALYAPGVFPGSANMAGSAADLELCLPDGQNPSSHRACHGLASREQDPKRCTWQFALCLATPP